jgi:RHS repeat-associated protein
LFFTLNTDDELTATSGGFTNSYSYNANGEQTNRTLAGTSNTLAFDYDGQLTSITQGSNVTSFAYDALGRRYSRTSGGTTTRFFYGPGGILCEKQGSTVTAAYAWGNGLIRKDGEYQMTDGLGSTRTVINSSQTVTSTAITEGSGQTVATTGSTSSPYGFAGAHGYRTDGDAGLTHVGARYYDAQVGRFITRDTYLDQHPYLYCEHDPVNYVDPSGHLVFLVAAVLVFGAIALTSPQPAGEPDHGPNPYRPGILPILKPPLAVVIGIGTGGGAVGGAVGGGALYWLQEPKPTLPGSLPYILGGGLAAKMRQVIKPVH